MLIERVVTCIGCEKAIKLFKDTQEVERHGGMQTKEGDRRYLNCRFISKRSGY